MQQLAQTTTTNTPSTSPRAMGLIPRIVPPSSSFEPGLEAVFVGTGEGTAVGIGDIVGRGLGWPVGREVTTVCVCSIVRVSLIVSTVLASASVETVTFASETLNSVARAVYIEANELFEAEDMLIAAANSVVRLATSAVAESTLVVVSTRVKLFFTVAVSDESRRCIGTFNGEGNASSLLRRRREPVEISVTLTFVTWSVLVRYELVVTSASPKRDAPLSSSSNTACAVTMTIEPSTEASM